MSKKVHLGVGTVTGLPPFGNAKERLFLALCLR